MASEEIRDNIAPFYLPLCLETRASGVPRDHARSLALLKLPWCRSRTEVPSEPHLFRLKILAFQTGQYPDLQGDFSPSLCWLQNLQPCWAQSIQPLVLWEIWLHCSFTHLCLLHSIHNWNNTRNASILSHWEYIFQVKQCSLRSLNKYLTNICWGNITL